MSLNSRELIIGVLLGLVGLLAWWYSTQLVLEPEAISAGKRKPDYVVEDLVGVTMDEQGRPDRTLQTPQLRHFPDDDSIELDEPHLQIFNDTAPPWHIRSERGWVSADGEELLMQGRVRAERKSTADLEPMTLMTSEMLLLPDMDYAETDRYTELDRGEDWAGANDGMQIWFAEPMRMRMFGRTRIRFATTDD
ncbi:MAG: LPS export ABC transporter periplasmic protein LptC [Thiohalocapsa sp. PB-PSB1]|nr:MAG: LPS export ABC transporter periplasmic protein LptC [Thiohalocapsa sp. PB-PSB1]